ncbi:MATE family multidrug resistance protein [Humitalea rosea]|uniref:Multidrug-efflux transporter n=1 Tax=Humitalea rosea TaxID=990373 RepID=A0A2W7I7N7_9PROT|nr:MATE family multidrug resistance protein [Humitalea rosea]
MNPRASLPNPTPGAEVLATLSLAWPLVLTNLSQMAMTVTDALVLGHHSAEALAAATLGANLYWALLAPGFGLALAAAPLLAQLRGRGLRPLRGRRGAVHATTLAVLLAVLPAWAVLWHTAPVLRLLGQTPALADLAQVYIRPMMWGLLPFCLFIVLRGLLAAEERPRAALFVAVGGILANAVFCWGLVFGRLGMPALGVEGAGIASSLANGLMLLGLWAAVARDRRLRRLRLFRPLRHDDPPFAGLRRVLRLGLPISGAMVLEIGVFSGAAFVIGGFGPAAIAAHAVTVQVASMTFMVPMGIGQAATARVGIAIGGFRVAAARRAGWVAMALCAGFMAMMAVVLLSQPARLAGLFLSPDDPVAPSVLALAVPMLMAAGAFQLADGVQVAAAGALRGLGDTRVPMLLAGLGYWGIGLPGAWVLAHPLGLGPPGIWIGLALGLGTVAVLMALRWQRLARHGGLTPARGLRPSRA